MTKGGTRNREGGCLGPVTGDWDLTADFTDFFDWEREWETPGVAASVARLVAIERCWHPFGVHTLMMRAFPRCSSPNSSTPG